MTGTTTVFGENEASGEYVHIADFSDFMTVGMSYTLEVDGETSHPFEISDDIYTPLKYDALAYFYHNRSGITITMPYAGGPQWTRPAGHINVPPNQGDYNVPCFDQQDLEGHQYTGCNYTLDVVGGWYDAGDHGKYVVNGGISVWTLLNQYERTQFMPGANPAAFADGTMNIPENNNGVPDLLDEARWEMEFLLSMQVPPTGTVEGEALGGMVHHKVHDVAWTALGLAPDQDPMARYLYPPSTAATLNLAATGAQCARIWESIDAAFSARCLAAAEAAWDAALAHPDMYARDIFTGGGPYNDDDVSDEFYWAASELFITTGEAQYMTALSSSPHYLEVSDQVTTTGIITGSAMDWGTTHALGTISLALVPNDLPLTETSQARQNVIATADGYVAARNGQGYLLPYDAGGLYPWGSNSSLLNNMIVLGLAYDFTSNVTYLNAVSDGMDYLLGRNPMDKSYISGYGERPLENPHHRFWAFQANNAFPHPPAGAVSGGPNSGMEDPYIQTVLPDGCQPQRCYVDNIEIMVQQRNHDQLERPVSLGDGLPGR